MSPEQLWNAALGELELELSKANFRTWFEHTAILCQEGNTVRVAVPNTFTKKWLENKYHPAVIKALRRISDQEILSVSYEVISKKKTESPEKGTEAEQSQQVSVTVSEQAVELQAPRLEQIKPLERTTSIVVQKEDRLANRVAVAAGLNPRYTFDRFVVGKKNELAHAACLAVPDKLGSVYNPLFIYGGVGLGKTHLMQAVGHIVLDRAPAKRILYVTCEAFTNEYIKTVGEGRAGEFKDKYRSVDLLMVDDIQFLAGKEGTQEAFFHTFDHLHQHNKQVIITSDRQPKAIPTLEQRMISRFEGGMIVDVNIPDLETRMAILRQRCQERGLSLPQEIIQYIASNVQNNIRELEGALNRVMANHELTKEALTLEMVKTTLSTLSQSPKHGAVTMKKILSTVSDFFDTEHKDIVGNSRKKELVVPRQIAMYLMREEIHASYPNIGQELGGRDHTTAMHACQKITLLMEEDERTQNDVNMIKQRLYNS